MVQKKIQYVQRHTLSCRGAVDPLPDEHVDGTLLVGTTEALTFDARECAYGYDHCELYPAFHNGERAWLRRDVWQPAYGYSASGTSECIISFEDGAKLLNERGCFDFAHPASDEIIWTEQPDDGTPYQNEAENLEEEIDQQAKEEYEKRIVERRELLEERHALRERQRQDAADRPVRPPRPVGKVAE